jgi:hypothetical protein
MSEPEGKKAIENLFCVVVRTGIRQTNGGFLKSDFVNGANDKVTSTYKNTNLLAFRHARNRSYRCDYAIQIQ